MDQEVQKSNDESSSNNNTNGVLKDETLTKTPLINLEKPKENLITYRWYQIPLSGVIDGIFFVKFMPKRHLENAY